MKYTVDRFVENVAVCEDENQNFINIPKDRLPLETKEGDCLIEEDGFIKIDETETKNRNERIETKMDSLFE